MLNVTTHSAAKVNQTYLLAFIGPNTGVSSNVSFQIAALRKGFGTFHAPERLLNNAIFPNRRHLKMLQLNMTLQIGFLKVRLWTRVTFKRADA